MNQCNKCKHWIKLEEQTNKVVIELGKKMTPSQGICTRNPPIASPVVVPQLNEITGERTIGIMPETLWPITCANERCGEFSDKE